MSIGLAVFTLIHVAISLVAIGAGFVVLFGLLNAKRLDGWTATFLATTVATSVTGFFFPVHHFMPSHAVGIVSLLVLSLAIAARYRRNLVGAWRLVYVISTMVSLYLNVFVLVAQLFMKVAVLKSLAPTGSEPPFAITQLAVLSLFIVLTVLAAVRFRAEPLTPGRLPGVLA
jgi:hypothetical protein